MHGVDARAQRRPMFNEQYRTIFNLASISARQRIVARKALSAPQQETQYLLSDAIFSVIWNDSGKPTLLLHTSTKLN
jgi:hypothetical protein